jgi:hypothetical protein
MKNIDLPGCTDHFHRHINTWNSMPISVQVNTLKIVKKSLRSNIVVVETTSTRIDAYTHCSDGQSEIMDVSDDSDDDSIEDRHDDDDPRAITDEATDVDE